MTILYLRNTDAVEPMPNVKQSSAVISQWQAPDSASVIYPKDMKTTQGSAKTSLTSSPTEIGNIHFFWRKAWISPKLQGDQTISGTVTIVLDAVEGNALKNAFPKVYIYVWKGDDSGVRGVLLTDTTSATEEGTTEADTTYFNAVALTSVNALDGDRIVVELMEYHNNTKTVAYTDTQYYDAPAAPGVSRLDFSQTLLFQAEAQTYTKTWTTDVLFKKLNITTAKEVNALFKKLDITKTYLIDALFEKAFTKTADVDALFKKLDILKQKQVDALFKKLGILKTFGVDVDFLKRDIIKSFAIDARFGAIVTYTISRQIDALFKKVGLTKMTTVDVLFKKPGLTKAFAIDTDFQKTQQFQRQLDVLFKKLGITKSFGIDTWFGVVGAIPYTKAFALDVIFAYKVKFPELWLSEDGKILVNIDRPYTWVGKD